MTPLAPHELPRVSTKRWTSARKALVVRAVREGLITIDDALWRYQLSIEEFLLWQRMFLEHGPEGLKVGKIKQYRRHSP